MSKLLSKKAIIESRSCGLRYFDQAVAKVGREKIVSHIIKYVKDGGPCRDDWSNADWALPSVVDQILSETDEYQQTYNIDEALNPGEIERIARECQLDIAQLAHRERRAKRRE